MKVCVHGLWHLGCVTAAGLAERGHDVVGLDDNAAVVARLADGYAPLFEPGLDEMIRRQLDAGRLRFTTDPAESVRACEVLWVAYDTPVNERDEADTESVFRRVIAVLPLLAPRTLVLVSSQLPVGSVRRLESEAEARAPGRGLRFACSPENLRLGQALRVFLEPDRIVVGCRSAADRETLQALLGPLSPNLEWMGVESAEMTKHAINSFLAASVAFANEIAVLCESRGADAAEVARGLKTDARIGPRAYLSPGGAFAGGTLARDVSFLAQLGRESGIDLRLVPAIRESNDGHRGWPFRRLGAAWGGRFAGRRAAVWGLAYKPGTDTLRRSSSVELCVALSRAGASVRAFDPAVRALPPDLAGVVELAPSAEAALRDADALVVATPWPEFREVPAASVVAALRGGWVLDANRFLAPSLGGVDGIRYVSVGCAPR